MMIIFQNKIIYMPGVPLYARKERIEDYARHCVSVTWREHRILTNDQTNIALCVGEHLDDKASKGETGNGPDNVVILYFQG